MKADRTRLSTPPIGATTLLTVFAVLALTVFALLTLSDARADARLSDAAWQTTKAYYAADAEAQEILARLRAGERPEGVTATVTPGQNARQYAYTCPISDDLELQVEVELSSEGNYRVRRWQMVSTRQWEAANNLEVWTGELSQGEHG